jgi:DNA-binding transcriptional LysR family regulator
MAAKAGAGLLLQPEVLVAEELASGRLVRVLEPTPRAEAGAFIVASGFTSAPKLTEFIAHILLRLGTI